MGKKTRVVGDASYEELASGYQIALTSMLDEVLKEAGVTEKKKRRKICEGFLHAHGTLHDQCSLRVGGVKVYPFLGFSVAFQGGSRGPDQLGNIVASADKSFSFDEYAAGSVQCHYAPQDGTPKVEIGLVEGEEAE